MFHNVYSELNSQIKNRIVVIHEKYSIKQSFKIKVSKIHINVQYFLYAFPLDNALFHCRFHPRIYPRLPFSRSTFFF